MKLIQTFTMMGLAIICLLTSGCIVLPATQARVNQDIADFKAINSERVKPSEATRDMNARLAEDIRLTLGVELDELPQARTPSEMWEVDPDSAYNDNRVGLEKEPPPETFGMLAGSAATIAAMFGLGLLAKTGGPLGIASELLSTLLVAKNPKDAKTLDILFKAIELYKLSDPDWESNKLLIQIGHLMPSTLKDHIKTKIVAKL